MTTITLEKEIEDFYDVEEYRNEDKSENMVKQSMEAFTPPSPEESGETTKTNAKSGLKSTKFCNSNPSFREESLESDKMDRDKSAEVKDVNKAQ